MRLYGFWRSSATFRVRIALAYKRLPFELVPVRIVGGAQFDDAYRAQNPQALVPTLVDDDVAHTQSLAILEYLEERHPKPPLLPADVHGRARVRAIAQAVACEIQPFNNLRVEKYLKRQLGLDEERLMAWRRHWVEDGFDAVEKLLDDPATGRFCHGETPTIADCCLVPQARNAERYALDLARWPTIDRIVRAMWTLDAVRAAAPEAQPDFEG